MIIIFSLLIIISFISPSVQDSKLKPAGSLTSSHYMISGGLSTAFSDILLFPIDTIKVKQQSSKIPLSPLDAVHALYNEKGLSSFFKGALGYAVIDGAGSAIFFASYEIVKKIAAKYLSGPFLGLATYPSAAIAFSLSTILLVPAEVVKTRMQTNSNYQSVWDCIRDSTSKKNGGAVGLYTGYSAALFRDMPYFAFQLGFFENIQSFLQRFVSVSVHTSGLRLTQNMVDLFSGVAAGVLTGLLTNPMDVVTARMMTQHSDSILSPTTIHPIDITADRSMFNRTSSDVPYTSLMDCFKRIFNEEGWEGFLSGVATRLAWIAPYTTISLNVNEKIKRGLMADMNRKMLHKKRSFLFPSRWFR